MPEKLIDLVALRGVADDLADVARDLSSCHASEAGLVGTVGHEGLAVDVEHFRAAWADELESVTEDLGALASALQGAADAFQEVDDAAAAAIAQAVLDA